MSVLFVADLHYALRQFDWLAANVANYNAVIIGGDLLDLASALDTDVQIVVVKKYLDRLQQFTRVVVSSGNHDCTQRSAAGESYAEWLLRSKASRLFVDGDSVDQTGTLITVCPWWDGPVSRQQVQELIARDAAKVKMRWIWIHHAPPDQSPVSWTGKKFGGDQFLVEWIREYQPDLVLSGHIHNAPFLEAGSWIDRLGKTWVFNPGRQPGAWPTYLCLDLDKMTVRWMSAEGSDVRQLANPPASLTAQPDVAADA
jgi:Icc-related predicted phosphoesterase